MSSHPIAPFRRRLPGLLASGLMLVATGLWTFWGFMEMYYEGWGQTGPYPLAYLAPACLFVTLWLLAEVWPRIGGWILVVFGLLFTAWIFSMQLRRGSPTLSGILSWIPVTGMVILVGSLFLMEGRRRMELQKAEVARHGEVGPGGGDEKSGETSWIRLNLRFLLPPATLLLIGLVCTAVSWHVFFRTDDGDRGPRIIRGNEVTLVWAPAGPGWAQSEGGIPGNLSWNEIAGYGVEPVGFGEKPAIEGRDLSQEEMERYGLFRYLAEDGITLMDEPQDIWRMPTVDEIVRSLVRDGENAGCVFPEGRERGRASCTSEPDKETPLWAPDYPFIYLWSARERDGREAYYVSYNGRVGHQPKSWGNVRHGHRFVRENYP